MIRKLGIVLGISVISTLCLKAENIIFNGSFELGTNGFVLEKELRPDTNPELKFLPLTIDKGAPGAGKNSLKMENPYAEVFGIYSKEFKIEPSTTYTLSGKIKCSKNGERVYFGVFNVDPHWSAFSHTVKGSNKWTDFKNTFTTTAKKGYYHILIRQGSLNSVGKNTLYLDDLKLVKDGTPSTSPVESAVYSSKTLYYLKDENAKTNLVIHNPLSKPVKKEITVNGCDEYSGEIIYKKKLLISLDPNQTKSYSLNIPFTRYAGIRLKAKGDDVRTHDGFFAVIGKYNPVPIDIARDYVVAFNGGMNYISEPQRRHPSYLVFNSPFGENMSMLSKLGCRIIRSHDGGIRGVDWPAVEPERGKFDFSHLDRVLNVYEKNHITLFPVIGSGFIDNYNSHRAKNWPDWVEPLCKVVKNHPSNCMKQVRGHVLLPPIDLFKNYIYQVAKHVKERIPVYEVANEPNLYLASDVYVKYLKVTTEAIKSVNSKAKICGFCLTSDFGANGFPWMERCIKLGGLKYVDIIGFHPYRGRTLGAANPADTYIKKLRDQLAPYGNYPLWNTELYFLIDQNIKHNGYEESLCKPHHVVWRFLTDLGEGVGQSISIPYGYLWKKMLTPNMLTGGNYHELIPSENFVAYNAMARLFERAKNVKKLKLSSGIICYIYRKDGKLIAAIWNYMKKTGVYGNFNKFKVMDIFGNSLKPGEYEIGIAPHYLTPGNLSDKEFISSLEHLKIRLDNPLTVSKAGRLTGNTLMLTMRNDSDKVVNGFAGMSGEKISAIKPVAFKIPAHSQTDMEIPVKVMSKGLKRVDLMIQCNGQMFKFPVKIVKNILLKNGEKFTMSNAEGTVKILPDSVKLNLHVKDNTNAGQRGKRQVWETDCVELFFDTAPKTIKVSHSFDYTPNVSRIFITPGDQEKLSFMGTIKDKDCKLKLTRSPNGYDIELTIAMQVDKYLGFGLKIDDAKANGGKIKEASLHGGTKLYKNRLNFSIIEK